MEKRKRKTSLKIRFTKVLGTILVVFGIYSILMNAGRIRDQQEVFKENEQEIATLKGEIEDLSSDVARSDTLEFVEEVAREDLGMVKPKEVIFVNKSKVREKNQDQEDQIIIKKE